MADGSGPWLNFILIRLVLCGKSSACDISGLRLEIVANDVEDKAQSGVLAN